jgi:hypothetical protein
MIIADCKQYDIPTYDEKELESMLIAWGDK